MHCLLEVTQDVRQLMLEERVTFLLIWLIRKDFLTVKYSSNTVCTIYSNNYTELDDVRVVQTRSTRRYDSFIYNK